MSKILITPKEVDEHPVFGSVQPQSFGRFKPFDLTQAASGYVYESDRIMPTRHGKKEILQQAQALLDNPFAPGIHYVTSVVDEARPALFAAFCARRAHHLYAQGYPKKRRSLVGFPRFEYVYGNFKHITQLIDMFKEHPPVTLVLAGLDINSSESKTDAFRDVLYSATRYQTCIMVVAAGCTPHQLHYDKLRIQPASYVHLSYPDLVKGSDI